MACTISNYGNYSLLITVFLYKHTSAFGIVLHRLKCEIPFCLLYPCPTFASHICCIAAAPTVACGLHVALKNGGQQVNFSLVCMSADKQKQSIRLRLRLTNKVIPERVARGECVGVNTSKTSRYVNWHVKFRRKLLLIC